MPRAIWTGSISFGLVNVPVKLFTATEDHSVSFRQFVKGYELEDGNFVLITAAKPYALLREAMRGSNRVAIARFVMRAKQHLAAIRVAGADGDAGDVLVLELVARKAEGERIVTEQPEEPKASVTDLMAVPEASVSEARQKRDDRGRASSEPTPPDGRFADMSKDELYEEAKRRGIECRSGAHAHVLVVACTEVDPACCP